MNDLGYKIEIGTWVNGAPTTIRTIQVDGDAEDGLQALRNIGHSWQYNLDHVGRLVNPEGKTVGILDIWKYTYRVSKVDPKDE